MSALALDPGVAPARVVVVDDTVDLRHLLRLALERAGVEVVGEAGDGREALTVVERERPDVVLLDLAMPVMDGLEALPGLRRLVPRAAIVVLSGFGSDQLADRALAAGADAYVQKGAPLSAIVEAVRDHHTRGRSVHPMRGAAASDHRPGRLALPVHPTVDGTSGLERAAVDLAPYGVLLLDGRAPWRVEHANPVALALLGVTDPEPVRGDALADLEPALVGVLEEAEIDAAASGAIGSDAPPPVREVEGRAGRLRVAVRRAAEGAGLVCFLDSIDPDVHVLRRAIATLAHEVRGPIAVINGVAETLEWSAVEVDAEQRSRLLSAVVRQARVLDGISADLLVAAQQQRGSLRVNCQPVGVRSFLTAIATDRGDVDLEVEGDPVVLADPPRLEQVVTNLLENARKYGRLPFVVRARPVGSTVELDVVDHGDGVPEEFVADLFAEFTRAGGTTAKGTGLGLHVVKTLVEAQGGAIAYRPGEPGGSVFTVTLRSV